MEFNFKYICPNAHSNNTTCFLCKKVIKIKKIVKNKKIDTIYGDIRKNH